jgi:hypothetical protein
MQKRMVMLVLALALVAGIAGGCSSSDSNSDPVTPPPTPTVSKFVGLWHMALAGDPGDPGFDWRFNADQATIVLYNTGSTTPKGGGTCTINGQDSTGTWSAGGPNVGRFTATLTGDNSMNFNFIEDKYSPPKTFVNVGTRLQ